MRCISTIALAMAFWGNAVQAQTPHDPELIHVDEYQPLPTPVQEVAEIVEGQPSDVVEFDLTTGRVSTFPAHPDLFDVSDDLQPGSLPLAPVIENEWDLPAPEGFGGLTLVQNPTNYPWSTNCKLFFRKNGVNYVASGTLIDSRHVITAGHVVHGGQGGQWSTNMVVVPAYANTNEPFGRANAVTMWTWTNWINHSDFAHDVGLIRLDRPIGALTGWHGYGYNNNCGFFTGGSWHHAGYPAESPFNGLQMFYRYGTYDGCISMTQAYHNNPSYGGLSGTGAYTIIDSARYVHGVHSARNQANTTSYSARLTSDKFAFVQSTLQSAAPSSVDLIPLDVNVAPSFVSAGSPLPSLDYLVHNYSNASWTGTVTVNVYISFDSFISPGDTLIQTHSFTHGFGPRRSVRIHVQNSPVTPAGWPTGSSYIGVALVLADANSGNNASHGWDAASVNVTCGSISAPTNVAATDGTYEARVKVSWTNSPGAASYEVWRKRTGSSTAFERIASNVTNTSFNDTTATPCVRYRYRVKARSACGTTSVPSTSDVGWRGSCDLLTANLAANVPGDFTDDGRVDNDDLFMLILRWGACPDCDEDLNQDNHVDTVDLGLLLALWR
jgi:V8-like Glu-specific endopeptidase